MMEARMIQAFWKEEVSKASGPETTKDRKLARKNKQTKNWSLRGDVIEALVF